MQLNISMRHGHVSEATQDMIREKLDKLTRLYERLDAIDATLNMEHRDKPVVDLRVTVKKHDFVSNGQAENLIAAVDIAIEKMEQQLRKHKEKVQDRHRGVAHHEPE